MDAAPRRVRRFQIRLSTVLLLTAIAAGGMATWPWVPHRSPGTMNCSPSFFDYVNPLAMLPGMALVGFVAWKGAPYALAVYARNEFFFVTTILVWLTAALFLILVRSFR